MCKDSQNVPAAQPIFWKGQSLTWQIWARFASTSAVIGSDTYCLFGCPSTTLKYATQNKISYTSTHTYIDLTAGSTDVQLDFFSPVSLTDYTRQSIPLSYLRVTVNNAPGEVDILTAIDDTWTAQQPNTQASAFNTAAGSQGFSLSGKNSYTYSEIEQQAEWGNTYLAATRQSGSNSTSQIGSASDLISQFSQYGYLNGQTSNYASGDLVAVAYSFTGSSPGSGGPPSGKPGPHDGPSMPGGPGIPKPSGHAGPGRPKPSEPAGPGGSMPSRPGKPSAPGGPGKPSGHGRPGSPRMSEQSAMPKPSEAPHRRGSNSQSPLVATFAIGLEQEQMFNYLGKALTGYYAVSVNYGTDLVDHFFADASDAYAEGSALDSQIVSMGQSSITKLL